MKTHLIMPMAGAGSRFYKNGYIQPKPIIEIAERPFFYWGVRSVQKFVDIQDITFVVLKDHIDRFNLNGLIHKYFPDADIIIVPEVTKGPVYTCLEGLRNIKDDNAIIFNDCDHMFKCSGLNNFMKDDIGNIDGALISFESDSPNFSYIKYNSENQIIGTVEKEVVSNRAICGAYMFKNADIFRKTAHEYLNNCPYKESFVSGMYNVMCLHNMNIEDFMVDFHVEFGTPEEYELAKKSNLFEELL